MTCGKDSEWVSVEHSLTQGVRSWRARGSVRTGEQYKQMWSWGRCRWRDVSSVQQVLQGLVEMGLWVAED